MDIVCKSRLVTSARQEIEAKSSFEFDPAKLTDHSMWPGSAVFHTARRLVGHAGLTSSDLDDLRQDLAIHVLCQWPKFDPERGSERTFLDRLLQQKKRAILRQRRAKCRHAFTEQIDLDVVRDNRRASVRSHVEQVDRRHDMAQCLRNLPIEDRHLANGLMTHNMSQLARLQKRHRPRLYESWRRLKRALEDAGLRGGW